MTVPGQYRVLEEHIQVHRYFMGLEQQREIPYDEAVAHFYDQVYLPVVQAIRERSILRDFPGRTEADLYLWLAEHRAALEEELGWEVKPEEAAADLAAQFSPRPQRVAARVGERILDAITPDELEAGPPPGQWRQERAADHHADQLFADLLVAINGEETGWAALDQALLVAQREGAQLHGLHVVGSEEGREGEAARAVRAEFKRRCEAAGVSGGLALEVGGVPRRICERTRWTDLVVLSLSHPPAPQPMARLGSGLSTIIRRCPRPVLAVPRTATPLARALLAYDGSPKAQEALYVATYLSGRWDIPLIVVTVMEDNLAASETLARARQYLASHGIEATFLEQRGPAAGAIAMTADERDCDLIVMGGYGASPLLEVALGSAVDEVLRTSRRPMLICR